MADKQDAKALAVTLAAGLEKDLGAVSAYAIAVEHGYEGTEEEWAAAMQKALNSVDESAASAQAAKESADAAAQSAKDAQSAAGEAAAEAAQKAAELVKPEIETIVTEQIAPVNEAVTELQRSKADAIVETASGESLHIDDASGNGLHNLKVYGKATQDGTPSPESPVPIEVSGSGGTVGVNFTGNQLFDASKLLGKSVSGASLTNNGDGSFTFSADGSSTSAIAQSYELSHEEFVKLFKVGRVYLKGALNTTAYFELQILSTAGNLYVRDNRNKEITEGIYSNATGKFLAYIPVGANVTQTTVKPMFYQDGDGTWEPFKEPQSLTIQTPNGLPGIPVESGGNYTDESGQQWICDYIDFERGKYVQNCVKIEFDGSEQWFKTGTLVERYYTGIIEYNVDTVAAKGTCTHFLYLYEAETRGYFTYNRSNIGFAYAVSGTGSTIEQWKEWIAQEKEKGNPLTVILPIKTPVETGLSAEEIAAYKALHTNKLVTNVFSDTDPQVGIEMEYGADTKTYIDKKFDALATAILKIGE